MATINGTGGNDTLLGGAASDSLSGLAGNDLLLGAAGNDTLVGGAGNDTLDGGIGADSLNGGLGNDLYRVDSALDVLSEAGGDGIDTLESSVSWTLDLGFEHLTLLGANLGQREGDILRLCWSQFDGSAITLRQGKTGVLLAVPAAKELRVALDRMTRQSPTILICETTMRLWKPDYFRHEFRRIANIAGLPDLQFLDLRRTAVVRLAEAGCTVPEIAAITGHQLDRTARILETYLPRNAPMAEAAIRKLDTHTTRTKLDD